MTRKPKSLWPTIAWALILGTACPLSLQAYIGPGAGFAFVSSFLVLLLAVLLAGFSLLSWPLRLLAGLFLKRKGRGRQKTDFSRVVVVGLDGMDPKLAEGFMTEGLLPNFQRLKERGDFTALATSEPAISPVAWSTFSTGVDASYHNIYDFLTRDPCTYAPILSSAQISAASRVFSVGKYLIPLGKPRASLRQKSKPFWKILGERGIFSSIIRVPVTFPPEKFHGVLLSGMCTPDLKGSQGTFSFYTSNGDPSGSAVGGTRYPVSVSDNRIRTELHGPENPLLRDGGELTVPMEIRLDPSRDRVRITVSDQEFELQPGNYSPWIRVVFRPGLGMKIHGICLFHLNRTSPHFELYVSPVHIDPEHPSLPISHPFIYSVYLAKLIGPYGTLGLAEDTWALNEGAIDEEAFLKQAYLLYEEREKMFFKVLERTPEGVCACVFDTTDRVQHMFFRCLDPDHPSNRGKETEKYRHVIRDLYIRTDRLLGRLLQVIDDKTLLLVISDHGFTQFKRGLNLNAWLRDNGYLFLKEDRAESGDWLQGVDWERTRAFALGLTGVFINRKGREASGIVEEGASLAALRREISRKLTGLVDPKTGLTAIRGVVETESAFTGPYTYDAPDLLVRYNAGYRTSWAGATGRVTPSQFEDNTRHWSGDHCVDPALVPGVLFSNRRIQRENPGLTDIAPTVLKALGVEQPGHMKGRPLI
ncbi:MAG: nucleotide pyrophosphatase [Acidobacteria bacterium]|nr:nucleotide pyrophosphatase [Acidobacteriota bacterium]